MLRHALAFALASGFLLLAWGSKRTTSPTESKPTPFDAAVRTQGFDELERYMDRLGGAYEEIDGLDFERLDAKACVDHVEARDTQLGRMRVRRVYGPFLERFARDDRWQSDLGPWAWLTEPVLARHFEEPLDRGDRSALRSLLDRLEGSVLPERYLAVVWPTAKDNVMPGRDRAGRFTGWCLLVDQVSGDIACHFPLQVTESTSEQDAPDADSRRSAFKNRIGRALSGGLPNGSSLATPLGSPF